MSKKDQWIRVVIEKQEMPDWLKWFWASILVISFLFMMILARQVG